MKIEGKKFVNESGKEKVFIKENGQRWSGRLNMDYSSAKWLIGRLEKL